MKKGIGLSMRLYCISNGMQRKDWYAVAGLEATIDLAKQKMLEFLSQH